MKIQQVTGVIRNWLQWTILSLLIFVALYVTAGRLLIGSVGNYEQQIEEWLSEQLAVRVQIEDIEGSWYQLDPILEVGELSVGGLDGQAISIKKLTLKLDSLGSLFSGEPVVKELIVDRLAFLVYQNEEEAWRVSGLPASDNSWDSDRFLDRIERINYLRIENLSLMVSTSDSNYEIDLDGKRALELARFDQGYYLYSLIGWTKEDLQNETKEIFLGGSYSGDLRNIATLNADLYLNVPEIELSDFLPKELVSGLSVPRLSIQGDMWLKANDGLVELIGDVALPETILMNNNEKEFQISLANQFRLSVTESLSQIALQNTKMFLDESEIQIPDMSAAWRDWSETGVLVGKMASIDIEKNIDNARLLMTGLIGVNKSVGQRIKSLKPRGRLDDIAFFVKKKSGLEGARLIGRMEQVEIHPDGAIPGVENFSGHFSLGVNQARLRIISDQLTLHIANMFEESWYFDQARGELNLSYDSQGVRLASGLLNLAQDSMKVSGRLLINSVKETSQRTWGLTVGIVDGKADDAGRYLPNTLSDNLKTWLNRALVSGKIAESGLLFHGSFGEASSSVSKVYQLYFKAEDTLMNYNDSWPVVDGLEGVAYIRNRGVTAAITKGRMLDSEVTKGIVTLPMDIDKPADNIFVDTLLSGSVLDGIRILNETPVSKVLNNVANDWSGVGNLETRARIRIPLKNEIRPEEVDAQIEIQMNNASLVMPQYDLEVSRINGVLGYSNKKGLSGSGIKGELFGEAINSNISTRKGKSGDRLLIDVVGAASTKALYDWSKQTLLLLAEGTASYEAMLTLPFGASNKLHPNIRVSSDLTGVNLRIPEPFHKKTDENVHFSYVQIFSPVEQEITIELRDQVRAKLLTQKGKLSRGSIHVGSDKYLRIPSEGLQVKGRVSRLILEEWESTISYLDEHTPTSLSNELSDRTEFIEMQIDYLDIYGFELNHVDSFTRRGSQSWNVHLENQMLSGNFVLSDDVGIPLGVSLDYLRFENDEGAAVTDPLEELNPSRLINVDFSVSQISYGEDNYGTWAFRFRPTLYGAELYDINAETRGLNVEAGSRLAWKFVNNQHESRFTGVLNAPNLESALNQWGIAHGVEGQGFKMHADVQWPGSPVMVDINKLVGFVDIDGGEGRFVQVEKGGALKVFGVFDFASIARRFKFDFSDIVEKGYSYNKIKGTGQLDNGLVTVIDPVTIEGSSSTFTLAGSVNLITGDLDSDMIVTLPITRNLPWYAAIITGPLAGVGTFLVQKIFNKQINRLSSAKYKITGSLDEPMIEFVKVFDTSLREAPGEALEKMVQDEEAEVE